MGFIQPFSFLEAPDASGAGFPALSGTLVDYWQTNAGVTVTAGKVTDWSGQVNSNVLEDVSAGPVVSGSNAGFNGVDTFTFDGSTSGLGKIFSHLGGVNTGNLWMALYGAPHGDGPGWGAIHGLSGLQSPFDFNEGLYRAPSNTSNAQLWGYPPGGTNPSSDISFGKGIYTVATGTSNPNGRIYLNKGTTVSATGPAYSTYSTTRQGYTIGNYNINLNGQLHGKVDVAGIVLWTNPTDFASAQADITKIEGYFQGIYG